MVQVSFPNPFKSEGVWLKGNLHSHTDNSDGVLNPSQLAFLYKANGYDFIAITDHNKLTPAQGISEALGNFIVIEGEEINAGRSDVGTSYHIVALDIHEEIPPEDEPQKIIENVKRQGGEVVIAHPYWSALAISDLLDLKGYLGIEIFNSSCLLSIGKGYSTVHWDDLLVRDRHVYGFAVDDTHWHFNPLRPVDACYAWIMVKAKDLAKESIMDSLRQGLFYSSNGPTILDVEISKENVKVECSPARTITFMADNSKGRRLTSPKEPITEGMYEISGNEKYLRIEVEDADGKIAWTNPIFFVDQ